MSNMLVLRLGQHDTKYAYADLERAIGHLSPIVVELERLTSNCGQRLGDNDAYAIAAERR